MNNSLKKLNALFTFGFVFTLTSIFGAFFFIIRKRIALSG